MILYATLKTPNPPFNGGFGVLLLEDVLLEFDGQLYF
jgi:hypothetical protein